MIRYCLMVILTIRLNLVSLLTAVYPRAVWQCNFSGTVVLEAKICCYSLSGASARHCR